MIDIKDINCPCATNIREEFKGDKSYAIVKVDSLYTILEHSCSEPIREQLKENYNEGIMLYNGIARKTKDKILQEIGFLNSGKKPDLEKLANLFA